MPVQGWHPRTYQGWPSLKSTSGHQRLPIFHQQIPTSPALVDFHHLIEGRLPGDQRPLSWQMTHDRRALQISRGQGSDPRRPWVVPGKDLHKLQGKYRWAWTPDPRENLQLLGGAGSGTRMLPALGSNLLSVCLLQETPCRYIVYPPSGGCVQPERHRLAFSPGPATGQEMWTWKVQVCLTCIL